MRIFLESFLTLVFVLGILIFIHEFGHFIIAKWLKIKVNVFSLGIGHRLLGFKWKETDYRISIIPLGGYVKLAGEHFEEHNVVDDSEFLSRPKFQRLLVLVMGSTFNILLCILLMTLVFIIGIEVVSLPEGPLTVGYVMEGSPGEEAGIFAGDEIIEVNDKKVDSLSDFEKAVVLNPNSTITLLIKREGELMGKNVNVIPNEYSKYREGFIGIFPKIPAIVGGIFDGSPAERGGLKEGDRIIGVDDARIEDFYKLKNIISKSVGKPLKIILVRNGEVLETTVIPDEEEDVKEKGVVRGFIGFYPKMPTKLVKKNFPNAFVESLKFAKSNASLIFIMLKKLIRGDLSFRIFSGPIEIATFSREHYRGGIIPFIYFIAIISLNLGIINLLPIPALDGGHIMIIFIEGVTRRDLNNRIKEIIMQIGLLFLVFIMAIIIYFDIIKSVFS